MFAALRFSSQGDAGGPLQQGPDLQVECAAIHV